MRERQRGQRNDGIKERRVGDKEGGRTDEVKMVSEEGTGTTG